MYKHSKRIAGFLVAGALVFSTATIVRAYNSGDFICAMLSSAPGNGAPWGPLCYGGRNGRTTGTYASVRIANNGGGGASVSSVVWNGRNSDERCNGRVVCQIAVGSQSYTQTDVDGTFNGFVSYQPTSASISCSCN